MNDNKLPRSQASLSQQLSNIFDHMDEINSSFKKIEAVIKKEYNSIETNINPENSRDVSKELQYYMIDFLKNIVKEFENKHISSFLIPFISKNITPKITR